MSNPSLISIIIPVYNGENHIRTTLDSIFSITISVPWELIIVDDESTDETAGIVSGYDCRYYRIKKSGASAARNTGIRESKGEILFFFDADVTLLPGTMENFLRHLSEDDAPVIQGRWAKESPNDTFFSSFLLLRYAFNFIPLMRGRDRLQVANLETGCLAVRREVFENCGLFDEGYRSAGGEEHELGARIIERYPIYYYPDIFVRHAFGSVVHTIRKIHRRTTNFAMLSFASKREDFLSLHAVSAPKKDMRSVVLVALVFIGIMSSAFSPSSGLTLAGVALASYVLNILGFVRFMASERGLRFALRGIAADFIIMVPRVSGLIIAAALYYILGKRQYRK